MIVRPWFAPSLLLLVVQTPVKCLEATFEYATAAAGCPNLAPGLDRMAVGVDITKLDLFHDYTVDALDGFTSKIIEYTCTEGKTWDSPYESKTYQIPDQIEDFSALSAGVVISKASVYSEKNDLKKEMAAEVGLDLSSIWGSFSSSLTYETSFQNLQTVDKSVASNKAHVTVTQAAFAPARFIGNSSLSKYFIFDLEDLPSVFNKTSEEHYFQLIRTYGTHLFHRSHFGGVLSSWFAISKSLSYEMSSSKVVAQVRASFLTILKVHGAYTGEIESLDERFTGNSSHTERYFGGQANLFDSEGFKAWWSTIAGNPWLTSGSLVPITDLLSNTNPKKAELLRAMEAYRLAHSVDETRRLVRLYQSFLPKYTEDATLQRALEELSDESMTREKASAIDREVQEYVIKPNWFGSNFKLCLTATGQAKECTPFGKKPDRVPVRDAMDYYSVNWDVDGPLDLDLFRIVWLNTSLSTSEESYWDDQSQKILYRREVSYEVNVTSAPAWIKYSQFGVRYDDRNGATKWYLNDPFYEYRLSSGEGETYAFFVLPAPL